ncbi:M protein [Helicobacter pylori]|uniref:M protein n=1 Tax=Helicobacter pylori TaxID=210 RepID=UPI00165AA49C
MGSFFSLGKSSNDTQENPKDAQKSTSFQEKYTKPTENTELTEKNKNLTTDKERLERENKNLATEKNELTNKITGLSAEKDNLTNQLNASQKQVKALQDSKQVLENEKTELSKDKENLTKEKAELEQKHAPYEKLEKLYEVFLEVKDRLNFNFVATTHSAMDLIVSVLSDSKYYVESLYNKASQELSDKRSDKGEKLAELFDLLFEYIKDSKFERLKEPSAYDHSCKTLYPEQNSSQKIQRVVLRGYTYDKKIACYTIVDMGS